MDGLQPSGANASQIEYWNGPAGDKWARLADTQDQMLAAMGGRAIEACDIRPGHAVLDIGCGSGTTTIAIARRVGAQGRVLGVDISIPMLAVGRTRVDALAIDNLDFENQDVATCRFQAETFDRAFSRFGVMFFADPVAAFANIRSGMKSTGRLAFVCWQAMSRNQWVDVPMTAALRHVPAPRPADPHAPGPMAFADPDRVRGLLSGAGFADIGIAAFETLLPIAPDVPAAVERLLDMGPAARLLGDASAAIRDRVRHDIGDALAGCQTDDGVMLAGAAWIVTATPS